MNRGPVRESWLWRPLPSTGAAEKRWTAMNATEVVNRFAEITESKEGDALRESV